MSSAPLAAGWKWLLAYRRRLAPVVLACAVLVVGGEVLKHAPAGVQVELPVGEAHTNVERVDVAYIEDGELIRHVSLRFPDGAPERVRHRVELPPGRYRVEVDLHRRDGGTESRSGQLIAPAEGVVRLHLEEET